MSGLDALPSCWGLANGRGIRAPRSRYRVVHWLAQVNTSTPLPCDRRASNIVEYRHPADEGFECTGYGQELVFLQISVPRTLNDIAPACRSPTSQCSAVVHLDQSSCLHLMTARTSYRILSAILVVNIVVWRGRTAALSMLASSAVRSSSRIIARRWWIEAPHIAGKSSRRATPTTPTTPGDSFVLTGKGWAMAAASASTVTLQTHVEDARRDGASSENLGEARPHGSGLPKGGKPDGLAPASTTGMLARIVPAEEPWLTEAGGRLREGKLVAFPTETVYGLGANALSESAVLKIFEAKQRPLTDPLIVHVPDTASALAFLDFDGEGGGGDKARRLLALLGEKLWPGPLTLILKASSAVPACVTANTGFVGVRCPAHPVTRQLLTLAGVPVAGPSANRFGHVSPTRAVHVTADLGDSDIMVVNGDPSGACGVGIESTVAKIDVENNRILVLRMGGVTQAKLKEALACGGDEFSQMNVHAGSVAGGKVKAAGPVEEEVTTAAEGQAPGQLLKHYSPDLEVFRVLASAAAGSAQDEGVDTPCAAAEGGELEDMARTSVVIDFAGRLKRLEPLALAYLDLSVGGDAEEAATGLFEALRWAEAQPSAQRLLISGPQSTSCGDMAAAVNDRIYRAASGKTVVG